jgi:hypothetical protein
MTHKNGKYFLLHLFSSIFGHQNPRSVFGFNAVLRIRNKSFGSGFGSGSGLKLVSDSDPVSDPDSNPDLNPDSNPGFESGSESWIRIFNGPNFFFY